jgi:hypothetical protein
LYAGRVATTLPKIVASTSPGMILKPYTMAMTTIEVTVDATDTRV